MNIKEKKIKKVMTEFKNGQLKSSSGKKVKIKNKLLLLHMLNLTKNLWGKLCGHGILLWDCNLVLSFMKLKK